MAVKRLFMILLVVMFLGCIIFMITESFADTPKNTAEPKDCPVDQTFSIDLISSNNQTNKMVLDGMAVFRLNRGASLQTKGPYLINYFCDGVFKRFVSNAFLPYDFKQTYAGLLPGQYKLKFMFLDNSGNCGYSEITALVKHAK